MPGAPTHGRQAHQPAPPNIILLPLPGPYPRPNGMQYIYAMPVPQAMYPNKIKPDTIVPQLDARGKAIQIDLRRRDYGKRAECQAIAGYSLLAQPVKDIQLICREFPWVIRMKGQWVTCGMVWESVHKALREPITDTDWGFITRDGNRGKTVEKAMKKRLEENPTDAAVPLRIDYLGDTTVFKGLERDNELVEKSLMPGKDKWDTWVIRLGRK